MNNRSTKNTCTRIPLEERMKRLEAGNASSPRFSREIINRFCDTPIFPALESMGAFDIRERLCRLLKEHYGWKRAGNVTTTYGDIAALIADRYIEYNGTVSKEWKEKTLMLISTYFTAFDSLVDAKENAVKNNRCLTRDNIVPMMKNIYDFIHVSLDDYNDYALSSGLPNLIRDKRNEFRNEKGFSSHMSPLMLYNELKYDAGLYGFHFGMYANGSCNKSDLSLEQCFNLINYFICPIAAIAGFKYKNRLAANVKRNSDIKSKGEKYYE